jgi:hypothetical protein
LTQCVTLVLMVGVRTCFLVDLVYHFLHMTRRLIIVIISAKKFKNPLNGEIIMDQTDHVNIPSNVNLKLTVGIRELRMPHHRIIVNICAKKCQNPLMFRFNLKMWP